VSARPGYSNVAGVEYLAEVDEGVVADYVASIPGRAVREDADGVRDDPAVLKTNYLVEASYLSFKLAHLILVLRELVSKLFDLSDELRVVSSKLVVEGLELRDLRVEFVDL